MDIDTSLRISHILFNTELHTDADNLAHFLVFGTPTAAKNWKFSSFFQGSSYFWCTGIDIEA